jgi:hypothetical protein
MMTVSINSWQQFLGTVVAINVIGWSLAAFLLYRRQPNMHMEDYTVRRWQLALSALYVVGCGYRSLLPVYDVPRICLVDSWLSSVMMGRSVATIAELAFVAQWALMLREASRATGSTFGKMSSQLIFPLIVVAEVCSWYSVLTTSNIGHVVEESLWGISASLLVASLIAMGPHCTKAQRRMLDICCLAGVAYVAYMFSVDVPMYWSRWIADEAHGRHYLSVTQGLLDVSSHWRVSFHWDDWKNEVIWMSVYFSVAVWLSISLVHAPVPQRRVAVGEQKRLPAVPA